MSIESVRAFFAQNAPDITVIESPLSSATVTLAAEAYGVEPGRIAKTLSLRIGECVVLIVTAGTSRLDNKKLKARFGGKSKMLGLDEVAEITGHEVGGVCPFGLKTPLPIYCDISLGAAAARRGIRRHAVVRVEHRAAGFGKLRRILPQAADDPVDVRYLVAAKPPDIGRAGQLLLEGSAIFLRERRSLHGDTGGDGDREIKDNSVHGHLRCSLRNQWAADVRPVEGLRLQKKCGRPRFATLNKM